MAKFLTGNELNTELEKLFEGAEEQLILISPYIKLHDRYISTLRTKLNNPKIEIIVVFGKNEENYSKSIKQEDFNFFKEFPNIEIRYEKRLHAKYYANESAAILTSMNLYTYSQDNNIEAGVLTKASMLGNFANNILTNVTGEQSLDDSTWAYFFRVIEQSDLLFKKVPAYESAMFGLSKKYTSSKIEFDKLSDFFTDRSKYETNNRKDYPTQKSLGVEHLTTDVRAESILDNNKIATESKFLSRTALAKGLGISSNELITKLEKLKWVERINDEWVLTRLGKTKGAQIRKGQYGDYIAWPEAIKSEIN